MSTSVYRKPQAVVRNVGNKSLSGAGEIRIPLNKDHLTAEHQVAVSFSQSFTTAPTAMGDLAPVIRNVSLQTDKGTLVNADGLSIVNLSALTEQQPSQRKTVGTTSTGMLVFDLHHENDGALQDLLSALESGEFSGLDLVLDLADPNAVGVYTGGAGASGLTFTVRVNAKTYPDLTGVGKLDAFQTVDPETGEAIETPNEYAGIGSALHHVATQVMTGTTSGDQQPVRLQAKGALLRFLQLATLDTTGANPVPSDAIIDEVRLVVGGTQVFQGTFHELQAENEAKRAVSRLNSGVAAIDYGDDEVGFLDIAENNEALLYIRVAAGAPASWEIRLTEDFTTEA